MKPFLPLSLVPSITSIALCLSTISSSRAQEAVPYVVGTGTQLELVGFPVHSPALDSGTVSSVGGTLIGWSPSFTDRPFGSGLRTGQEYYAEVVGPATHPWLGHRFELDEIATSARSDHGLAIAASSYNTRGVPNSSLAGACLEVRPHLTVDGLWGEVVKNRLVHGKESAASFLFAIPNPSFTREVRPFLQNALLGWHHAHRISERVQDSLIIPSGSSIGVDFGEVRGSSLGITGNTRTWPTAAPLSASVNLLCYPYPRDMRLGLDWGSAREGFRAQVAPSPEQDRLEIIQGTRKLSYAPELQASGDIRWRRLHPRFVEDKWAIPASYLDTIPLGQGFLLRKNKADPNHFFYPPKP